MEQADRIYFCALQADIRPQTDGCNGLRYNLTADIIESIFRTYPAGKKRLCDLSFWSRPIKGCYKHRFSFKLKTTQWCDWLTHCQRGWEALWNQLVVLESDIEGLFCFLYQLCSRCTSSITKSCTKHNYINMCCTFSEAEILWKCAS